MAGLAVCSALFAWYQVPGADLVRLTAAARVAGHLQDAIAAARGNGPDKDVPAVIRQQSWISPGIGPGPLFSAVLRAACTLDGRDSGCYPSLTWPWAGCGQQVTGRAPAGRRVRIGLGHAAGCAGLAGGEALRRDWLPWLIVRSEDPAGPVQRHWLAGRITGDWPRCGWHGYSGTATIAALERRLGGGWRAITAGPTSTRRSRSR